MIAPTVSNTSEGSGASIGWQDAASYFWFRRASTLLLEKFKGISETSD
jgi:hypothetical protein